MTKSKTKVYLSVLLLIVALFSCAALFTSCGGDKVEQIYVDNSYAPRLTYVQGQELDLQNGIITAIINGEESLIPMTDAGVTVTGYNRDSLGSQNLIVTYKEKTTSITVNVIPRLTVEGYETSYFTGDSIKTDKGKVKVAKDDATTTMVPLNDPRVTIEGFDSSTAGEKTVTAKYSDGSNTYTCTFSVTVYDAATSTITIVYPKKTNYGSHETELDFTGGYITIKGGANGKLEKHVDITKDMIAPGSYDPTVVNADNPGDTQTITINYLGKTFEYTIRLKYSSVSMVKDNLEVIKKINLSAENLTLTDEEKNASWAAISEYFELKSSEKDMFSEEDVNTIIRVASIGVTELYREELKKYERTILVIGEGIQFVCDTYENTVADLAKLKDSSETLNLYASVLRTLLTEHADLSVRGDKLIKDEIFVMPENIQKDIVNILTHLISLHRDMCGIPEDWTVESLIALDNDDDKNNDAEPRLYRIRVDISANQYYKNGQGNIYKVLSNWRTKGDFFEIVYSYFLYCNDSYGGTDSVVDMLDTVPWPKTIDTWYGYWYTVMNIGASIEAGFKEDPAKVFMTDLTPYNFYFKNMIDMAAEIKANRESDQLSADLYNLIAGDYRIRQARKGFGQLKLKGFLADEITTNFTKTWDAYLELVELYAKGELVDKNGKVITEGYESKYEAVMNKLCQLSPLELHEFLGSLNFYYGKTNSEILALSIYTKEVEGETHSSYLSVLATFMNAYYQVIFNDAEFEIFEKLLVAMESYARINKVESAKATFMTKMAEAIAAYGNLADKTLFDSKMGAGYTAYVKLYEAALQETNLTISDEALGHINAILDAAGKFENIRDYILSENAKPEEERSIRNEAYIVLLALYENVRYSYLSLADMAKESEELRVALYHNIYEYDGSQLTLEQIFGKIGNYYWNYLLGIPDITIVNGENKYTYSFYDVYIGSDLTGFLLYAADMLYAQFNENEIGEFSETAFTNAFNAYAKLDKAVITILEALETNKLYFAFVEAYLEEAITDEDTLALSAKLVEVAKAYAKYQVITSEENANSFKALVDAAKGIKELIASEEEYEKYIKAIYEYYTSIEISDIAQ